MADKTFQATTVEDIKKVLPDVYKHVKQCFNENEYGEDGWEIGGSEINAHYMDDGIYLTCYLYNEEEYGDDPYISYNFEAMVDENFQIVEVLVNSFDED